MKNFKFQAGKVALPVLFIAIALTILAVFIITQNEDKADDSKLSQYLIQHNCGTVNALKGDEHIYKCDNGTWTRGQLREKMHAEANAAA